MSDFSSCPSCGHRPYEGVMGGWFHVYKCRSCGRTFCCHCQGSNNGAQCPNCKSRDKSIVGQCG